MCLNKLHLHAKRRDWNGSGTKGGVRRWGRRSHKIQSTPLPLHLSLLDQRIDRGSRLHTHGFTLLLELISNPGQRSWARESNVNRDVPTGSFSNETSLYTQNKSFAVFVSARQKKKRLPTDRPTDQPTDGSTDGWTHPLIESWLPNSLTHHKK